MRQVLRAAAGLAAALIALVGVVGFVGRTQPAGPQAVHLGVLSHSADRIWNTGGGTVALLAPPGQRWVEVGATFVAPRFPVGSNIAVWPGIQDQHKCPHPGCLVQGGIGSQLAGPVWTEDYPAMPIDRPLAWRAGQTISVVITRIEPGEWRVEIKNVSTGASWAAVEAWRCGSCDLAEAAVEALPGRAQLHSPVRWLRAWAVTNTGKRWEIR